MNGLLNRIRKHQAAILLTIFRIMTYLCLALAFFGLMAVNNFQMRQPSRTLATTLLTFGTMCVVMNSVYGGYAVGKKKSKPVISSLSLSILLTDLVSYLQLQIMNVNENKNHSLMLFGEDFPWLLVCIAVQIPVVIFWVRMGNGMYFRITPPQKCLLVLGKPGEKDQLLHKIGRYRLQWEVTDVAMFDDPGLGARMEQVETVFLCDVPEDRRNELLLKCYAMQKNVLCRAALEDIMIAGAKEAIIDDAPFLEMETRRMTLGQRVVKRVGDMAVSGLTLVLLSPLMGLIALAILAEDGGPVIFRQKRATIRGRVFTIFKFRTMRKESEAGEGFSCEQGDRRVTRVGSILRRFRLDELPQMWNIFRGDMTLVGPRPEMLENVARYKAQLPEFVYREKMKAGLTGYAQIEGKYNTTPEDKLMLDLMYIESFSLWLDVKLIFRTLTVFFKSDSTEGFRADEQAAGLGEDGHDKDSSLPA